MGVGVGVGAGVGGAIVDVKVGGGGCTAWRSAMPPANTSTSAAVAAARCRMPWTPSIATTTVPTQAASRPPRDSDARIEATISSAPAIHAACLRTLVDRIARATMIGSDAPARIATVFGFSVKPR